MSSGEETAAQFPIRFADIIFAEILDPNGQNLKDTPSRGPHARHCAGGGIPHCGRYSPLWSLG